MKRLMIYKALLFNVILVSVLFSSCSSIPEDTIPFLKESGIYTVTKYAHPSSQIKEYTTDVSGNEVLVDVIFTNGYEITFNLTLEEEYFTEIEIIEDTDGFPSFLGTRIIKSIVIGALTTVGNDDFISEFENKIGRKIDELSGANMVLLILNWDYSNFKKRNS